MVPCEFGPGGTQGANVTLCVDEATEVDRLNGIGVRLSISQNDIIGMFQRGSCLVGVGVRQAKNIGRRMRRFY